MAGSHTVVVNSSLETVGFQLGGTRSAVNVKGNDFPRLASRVNITGTSPGVISEYVMRKGVSADVPMPGAAVILIREADMTVIDKTISATDGAYTFSGLNKIYKYTALAYDPAGAYRAQAANNLTPV